MNTRTQIRACFENVACLARSGQPDKEADYIEKMIDVVLKKEPLWLDTRLQAVRLVAEIMATQDNLDMVALCESMDLEMDELNELIDRIDKDWEESKLTNCPIT
jgi:hypothetical protein